MRADDWIVDYLVKKGVTDVFGIPGLVVMDFLYAVDRRKPDITPHLSYHEQGGAYAACGYAQATGKVGVAYATRGPGFTNMLTAMADAYYDSIPTMFFTAHSTPKLVSEMRVMNNQEIDTVELAKSITKKSYRIDDIKELKTAIIQAYGIAVSGRKGPVFLDIQTSVFSQEVEDAEIEFKTDDKSGVEVVIGEIEKQISTSNRPVILIGNGARGEGNGDLINKIANRFKIPVLSSRAGQDIVPKSDKYYGFVGSRATRYSNFILSKTDFIIAIGNRMAFPVNSKSFSPIVKNAKSIRIDVDDKEFIRDIPNCKNFCCDVKKVLTSLCSANLYYKNSDKWISVCDKLKSSLDQWDMIPVVKEIRDLMQSCEQGTVFVCDVGNHGFWVTTALAYAGVNNRILYSGSFGALGCALPKAIGAYYASRKPVICFTGDQGVQMNIQELQHIVDNKLPITVVVLNNDSSGMIMEREIAKHGKYLVHTTLDSGYSHPDFEKIAKAYGLEYKRILCNQYNDNHQGVEISIKPMIVEMVVDKDTELNPNLPVGSPCQDLHPPIPRDLYNELDNL